MTPTQDSDPEELRLERAISALFMPCCGVCVRKIGKDSSEIAWVHRNDFAAMSEKRKMEFIAGRLAARRALHKVKSTCTEVKKGLDGVPIWPKGYVGSISHSSGFAVAVASSADTTVGIGIDLEASREVSSDLWGEIFTQDEIAFIRKDVGNQNSVVAGAMFCVKEAFFKFQFPLTGAWVDFKDATVTLDPIISQGSLYWQTGVPMGNELIRRFRINYAVVDGLVAAGIYVVR
jgi:4'-phosphopantetheinyl transferase EntD